jgi:hypothetical protein
MLGVFLNKKPLLILSQLNTQNFPGIIESQPIFDL